MARSIQLNETISECPHCAGRIAVKTIIENAPYHIGCSRIAKKEIMTTEAIWHSNDILGRTNINTPKVGQIFHIKRILFGQRAGIGDPDRKILFMIAGKDPYIFYPYFHDNDIVLINEIIVQSLVWWKCYMPHYPENEIIIHGTIETSYPLVE